MDTQVIPKQSERRHATVMFIDISGFTEMSEQLDAEEVTEITNACFEMMGEVIEHYGGTIDKFIGDNIMVLFGIPTAIENACNKALNTAIEIRNKLSEFNKNRNLKIPLNVHIGVNTGEVIAGLVGSAKRKDYTVMGDTVNIAARLEDVSTAGQILVGASTHQESQNEFEFKTLHDIALKGKKEPTPVYELVSTKKRPSKPQLETDRTIYSEMVGREEAFNELKFQLQKVIDGKGSIVNVIGEPGIGKSRLILELQKTWEIQEVTYLKGAALSIGKDLSFHPIISMLKNWAQIKEEDDVGLAIAKLRNLIHEVGHQTADEVLPFVATLMGLQLDEKNADRVKGIEGEALEKLILKNLKDLIVGAIRSKPVVIVIEDVHWADLSSIELIEFLFRLAEKHPILFINVMRTNYKETGERLREIIQNKFPDHCVEIHLERLNAKQVELLISNLFNFTALPESIKTSISNKADGNPLFIEEVMSSLIDEGVVILESGRFAVTEKINSVVIPGSIQDVLMARLDRLDEENKALLKRASVIGRFFFRKILYEIIEHSNEFDDKLEFLQEVQLIRQRMRLKDIEYFFKHVLLQEVTYESILVQQRKKLHLEVAAAIERVFSHRLSEFYGVLSWHYSRGGDLEKAEEFLIKAGEAAVMAGASNEAINYFREALELYSAKMGTEIALERITSLQQNIALAYYNKGHMVEAVEYFGKAIEGFGFKTSQFRLVRVLRFLANLLIVLKNLYWPSGKTKKALTDRDLATLELFEKRGIAYATVDSKKTFMETIILVRELDKFDIRNTKIAVRLFSFSSLLFSGAGISFSISKKFLEQAKQVITNSNRESLFHYKVSEIFLDYVSGNWTEEYKIEDVILNSGLRMGDLFKVYIYANHSLYIALNRGDFEYANGLISKLNKIADAYDYDAGRFYETLYQLNSHLIRREFSSISEIIDDSIALVNELGLRDFKLRIVGMNAKAQILMGDFAGAEETLNEAKSILREAGRVIPLQGREVVLSHFLFDVEQFEHHQMESSGNQSRSNVLKRGATKSGKNAIKISRKIAEKRPESMRLMGKLHWLTNKQRKALSFFGKSIKEAQQLGARPELVRTYMEVGKRLQEPKSRYRKLHDISAEAYLDKAEILFKEMDLQWDLEQLEKVRSEIKIH